MKKIFTIFTFFLAISFSYSQFNQYVPQNPVNAMRDVGIYKQRVYDSRKEWIQSRIYELIGIINNLITKEKFPTEDVSYHQNFLRDKVVNYNKSIGNIDFADDYQFKNIQNNYDDFEDYFYKYYNWLVSKAESQIGKVGIRMGKYNGYIQIDEIIYGGSAWKSKQFEVNDKIIKVAQGDNSLINVEGMTVNDVRELITGTKGTIVRLTIQKMDSSYRTITLIRE